MERFVLAGTGRRVKDMQCWQCGVSIKPGQKLCVYCGAKLTQDDEPAFDAPVERSGSSGREMRRPSSGGGSRGARDDGGWSPEPDYDARSDRYGSRERGGGDRYQPGGLEIGGRGDGGAPRRMGGARSSSRDPMDDPRAPRNLRGTPSSGRPMERDRGRGGHGNQGYDDSEYEYDDYNPRDRASPRYQPRFDPESAEYDAVADQSRRSRVRPRQDESRARGYDWDDPRAGRDPRDGRQREEYGRGPRGGYGEGESAEYPANYDERSSRRDRGMNSPRGGGWDQYEGRGAGGFNAAPNEGWNAPAMGAPNAQNWNGGAWAPGADPNSWPPPGAGFAPAGVAASPKKRGRGGLIAAVVSLLVVVLLAGGGFLARGEILALLHHGNTGGATPAPAFATYTPGPTPTVLSNYKLYVSTRSLYAVEYPSAWNIQNQSATSGGGYDYLDTYQQANPPAEVGIESAQAFNNLSDAQIIAGEVNGAKQGGMTFSPIGNDVTVSIGGENWTRRDYSVTTSNNVTLHMALLATHHAGHAYAIVLTATTADFGQDDTGVFKTILSTFRFTS